MAVANAVVEEWFAVFGICRVIHADGGAEFRNALLHNIARQLNVGRTLISPGTPMEIHWPNQPWDAQRHKSKNW